VIPFPVFVWLLCVQILKSFCFVSFSLEMAGLKFYYDLISQPSRAVFLFLKATNIPFVAHKVALSKGVSTELFHRNAFLFGRSKKHAVVTDTLRQSVILRIIVC